MRRSVLAQLGGWFDDYNRQAPHSALGMRSPADYRATPRTHAPICLANWGALHGAISNCSGSLQIDSRSK